MRSLDTKSIIKLQPCQEEFSANTVLCDPQIIVDETETRVVKI